MIDLTPVFTAYVDVGAVLDLGITAGAHRRIAPIRDGIMAGPRLMVQIQPGGADWQVVRPNGTLEDVAASDYYLRSPPVFDVTDGAHGWLRPCSSRLESD